MRKNEKTGLVVLAVLVNLLSGCAQTTNPAAPVIPKNQPKSLNQPKISKLVVIGDAQSDVSSAKSNSSPNTSTNVPVARPLAKIPNLPKYKVIDDKTTKYPGKKSNHQKKNTVNQSVLGLAAPRLVSPAPVTVDTSIESTKTYTFMMMKGETYKAAIYRWLGQIGYTKVGFMVSDDYQAKLDENIKKDLVLTTSFNDAITHIHNIVVKEDPIKGDGYDYGDYDKKLKNKSETERLHVKLIGRDKAIVTTSILPVTMFEVKKGSLRENYLRLGKAYGWNVSKEFFLCSDYVVPFGYLIVTEKENVKKALEELLKPYPSLSGGKYNDQHQLFVMSEENK